jgi:hypothetical protein
MKLNTFKKDLNRGKQIELYVLKQIRLIFPSTTLIENKFEFYDIFIPEIEKKIEVKYDEKSQETGNILVELFMFNQPSALLVTKADYWVFFTGDRFIWLQPIKIIECLLMNNIPSRQFIGKGDTQPKTACLVNQRLLERYANIIQKSVDIQPLFCS